MAGVIPMVEVITLIKRTWDGATQKETTRDVLCSVRSISQREFYAASATDYHPEVKFVLADYLDYDDEVLIQYNDELYRVVRTYRAGQELELTAERAPAEEAKP